MTDNTAPETANNTPNTEATACEMPAAEAKAEKPKKRTRWYVVQTQTNYEKRVQHHIKEQTMLQNLDALVEEVVIPTEQVVEVKKGVKTTSERKFFPGYVLVKANMTDEVWHMIKSINHVTGFVGAGRGVKPLPISEKEAERILHQMEEGVETPRAAVEFEVGEEVRVNDGPFATFVGMVQQVDHATGKLTVGVSIFGRETPIELEGTQVEKV